MRLNINPHSGVPMYVQIADEIRHLIAIEGLRSGDRLPTVRELAKEHGINPGTVTSAYQTLEREGLMTMRQGRGAFVATDGTDNKGRKVKMDLAKQTIEKAMVEVLRMGVSMGDLEQLCRDRLEDLRLVKSEARESVEGR